YTERPGKRSAEAAVAVLQPSHLIFFDEFLPFLLICIQANADHNQGLAMEFSDNVPNVGNSLAAWSAPGGPEVQQNNLALQAVHSDPGSVNGCEGKRRRHTSTSEVGLGNVAAGALRGNIIGRFHRDIVFKLLFGSVVLMQTC